MLLARPYLLNHVHEALQNNPIVAILGPRQSGKTTLSRMVMTNHESTYYDLENPVDLAALSAPMLVLENTTGLVVLDEAQRKPELFEILRVLVDRPACKAKFLLLGSASPHLVQGVSETLAGRVSFVHISGFELRETGSENFRKLWHRGGFPRSFLAASDPASYQWRKDFIKTFLERDIPQLGISVPARTLQRFWTMLAHYHGNIWNASEFARSLGSTQKTATRYLDLLTDSYVIRQLPPWHENMKKRQVKSPKIYIRDCGILHALLSLTSEEQLQKHPKVGASWEGFVIEQILAMSIFSDSFFWSTYAGAELDVLAFHHGRRLGFEIKYSDAPRITKSMHIALRDLSLDRLYVIYPGSKSYPLSAKVEVLSILDLGKLSDKF
jgi:hypothetical protein